MPEVISFPVQKVQPRDWLIGDLLEMKEELEALPHTQVRSDLMDIVNELIDGTSLELRFKRLWSPTNDTTANSDIRWFATRTLL